MDFQSLSHFDIELVGPGTLLTLGAAVMTLMRQALKRLTVQISVQLKLKWGAAT